MFNYFHSLTTLHVVFLTLPIRAKFNKKPKRQPLIGKQDDQKMFLVLLLCVLNLLLQQKNARAKPKIFSDLLLQNKTHRQTKMMFLDLLLCFPNLLLWFWFVSVLLLLFFVQQQIRKHNNKSKNDLNLKLYF